MQVRRVGSREHGKPSTPVVGSADVLCVSASYKRTYRKHNHCRPAPSPRIWFRRGIRSLNSPSGQQTYLRLLCSTSWRSGGRDLQLQIQRHTLTIVDESQRSLMSRSQRGRPLPAHPPTRTRPTCDSLSMSRAGQTAKTHEEGKKTVENRKKAEKQMKKVKPSKECSHVTYCCDENVTISLMDLC